MPVSLFQTLHTTKFSRCVGLQDGGRVTRTLWYSANCDGKLHPDVAPRCTYVVTNSKSFWGYGILIRVFAVYVSRGHSSEIIKLLVVGHGQLRHA